MSGDNLDSLGKRFYIKKLVTQDALEEESNDLYYINSANLKRGDHELSWQIRRHLFLPTLQIFKEEKTRIRR